MAKKSGLEAFVEAVRLEKQGRDYFLDAASKAKNDSTRKIFQQIAEEEIRHIEIVNDIYHRMKESGTWEESEIDYTGFKGKKSLFVGIAKSVETTISESDDDVKALDHAMEIEKRGKAYYEKKAAETDVEFEKKFFQALAVEEEGHYLTFFDAKEFIIDPEGWLSRKGRSGLDGA